MATKPTTATYTCATDATYSSGPANTLDTKAALASAAQGLVSGLAITSPELNYMFNRSGQWSVWLDAGSSADGADAHLVETNSSGFVEFLGGSIGASGYAGSVWTCVNSHTAPTCVLQNNGTGRALTLQSTGGSAALISSGASAIVLCTASFLTTDQGGFGGTVGAANCDGIRFTVTAADANGAHYTVTTDASAVGVRVDNSTAGNGIESSNTSTGTAIFGDCTGAGIGVAGTSTGAGIGVYAASVTGVPLALNFNATRASANFQGSAADPTTIDDGDLTYRADVESWRVGVDSAIYGTDVYYSLHKSRSGSFYAYDENSAVQALGAIGSAVEIETLSANADRSPRIGSAQATIRVGLDVSAAATASTAQITLILKDTTAGVTIRTSTGYAVPGVSGAVVRIEFSASYFIPASGARNYSLEIADGAASGDSITVKNVSIEVRDAGI